MLNRFQWIIQFSYGVAAMQKSSKDQDTENAGCCPTEAFGCLLSLILFPICAVPSMWIAFAIGPMSCAFPSRCSAAEQNARGFASIVVGFGGGFGIPLVCGTLLTKVLKRED
jgi:hypothetical protein